MNRQEFIEAAVWLAKLPEGTAELPDTFEFYVCDDGMKMLSPGDPQAIRLCLLRDRCGEYGYERTATRDKPDDPWLDHWVFTKVAEVSNG